MVVNTFFYLFFLLAAYAAASHVIISSRAKKLDKRRKELVDLYVRRANLAPVFFTAARKSQPIPGDLYNRFINARDRFAQADRERDIRDVNRELDEVFSDFFVRYESCREPLYIKTREDYDKLMEKIHFISRFYEHAWNEWKRAAESPLRYGVKITRRFVNVMNGLISKLKTTWGKGIE
jgi:hypothetical protein